MSLVRQSITGLSIALLAVVILWAVWLTGQAEHPFARMSLLSADCTVPAGWISHRFHSEDDVAAPVESAGYTVEEILAGNCLSPDGNLPLEEVIYLPSDVIGFLDPSCGPPQGWGYFTTEAGDSLSSLADEFDVELEDLLVANCFTDISDFEPGLRIYAPISSQEP